MINVFYFLLSAFLLMLTWKFILATAWALRWVLLAGFIGFLAIMTPSLISAYQDNQRSAQQARDYAAAHPETHQAVQPQPLDERPFHVQSQDVQTQEEWLRDQDAKWQTR
jgi:hypothetical protein